MTLRITFGKRPSNPVTQNQSAPDWVQANPKWIDRALQRACNRPSGDWYVVDASRVINSSPRRYVVLDRELCAWRAEGRAFVAPNACPHMGASLADGCVRRNRLVCPWHGLELGPEGRGAWKPFETFDDGVLVWVRIPGKEQPLARPVLAPRPNRYVDAVIRMEATCEPEDVIANRLDPWHGVHFHPHSFSRLQVLDQNDDVLTLRVAYRVFGLADIEVDVTFHSPEPRTIVMTIVDGEGKGSVVETHATPLGRGRTAIVEATLATSDRLGFRIAMRGAPIVRPWIERAAKRLWVDDAAYAERRYALRS